MDISEDEAMKKVCVILTIAAAIAKPDKGAPAGCITSHCMHWEPVQVLSGTSVSAIPKGRCALRPYK